MPLNIAIIAGEPSGDRLGGDIVAAIKRRGDVAIVAGVGGPQLEAQGVRSLFDYTELSLIGIIEILKHLPQMIQRVNETVAAISAAQPDILITIDCPEFCKPVVARLRRLCPNTRFVHVVAPTVWAWRPGRARVFARLFDHLLCLLPFEPAYFEREGMKASFIGHPAVAAITPNALPAPRQEAFRLLLLPGSRVQEIEILLPMFLEALKQLNRDDLSLTLLTLPRHRARIEAHIAVSGMSIAIVTEKEAALAGADLALAASGTIGLELALARVPHIIAYRVNWLTALIGRFMIRTPYVHLANIILGRSVVPELIQERATTQECVAALRTLLDSREAREAQITAFDEVRRRLQTRENPADCAAGRILET